MYGYNAEPPIAIPITQYGSTVYIGMAMGGVYIGMAMGGSAL